DCYVVDVIQNWIEKIVIGQNLCPWALPALKSGAIKIQSIDDRKIKVIRDKVQLSIQELAAVPAATQQTRLLAIPNALHDFYDYLDFVQGLEAFIEAQELEGVIQVATFHPSYMFDGTDMADVENYTNRSPYPIIHLLREEEVEFAVENYSDTDKIYERNIATMETIGSKRLEELLAECMQQ
ncbi:unnamed protein product, partial [Heterosigma akashiwo]